MFIEKLTGNDIAEMTKRLTKDQLPKAWENDLQYSANACDKSYGFTRYCFIWNKQDTGVPVGECYFSDFCVEFGTQLINHTPESAESINAQMTKEYRSMMSEMFEDYAQKADEFDLNQQNKQDKPIENQ